MDILQRPSRNPRQRQAAAHPPPESCVPRLFELQAARTPDARAVVAAGRQLTYRELDEHSNQLARHLIQRQVGPESIVALVAHRTCDFLTGALAVLKAGGAYLPLDVTTPRPRLQLMLENAGAKLVLTHGSLLGLLPPSVPTVCFDRDAPEVSTHSAAGLPPRAVAANLAYVIYTSGTSGRPKAVAVSHAALANLAAWHNVAFQVRDTDRASMLANLAFDASVWEVWPYLTAGASLHLADEEARARPAKLITWMVQQGITVAFLSTQWAESVLRLDWPAGARLRLLLTGGDRLRVTPAARAPYELINNYGPTENAVVATSGTVAADSRQLRLPSIGFPIANVRVHLLDPALVPVPAGEPGELCIAGAGLARGYLGDPAQTAAQFVPNPCALLPGERLYRTGDLARWGHGGELEFVGRTDDQVKVQGFRVEVGEIEAALLRHRAVRSAIVVRRQNRWGDGFLVAYYVADADGGGVDPQAMKAFLRESLPDYMVPPQIIALQHLPLTAHGKLDVKALPAPADVDAPMPGERARSIAEQAVGGIWRELFSLREVAPDMDFFALGGSSLLASRMLAHLREVCRVDLSMADFFAASTMSGVVGSLEKSLVSRDAGGAATELRPLPRGAEVPLSFAQQRIWFLQHVQPRMLAYGFQAILRLRGGLRVDALRRGLQEIVRRHEIFRTTFPATAGRPRQQIHAELTVSLPLVDLTPAPAAARRRAAAGEQHEVFRRPFDLRALPLVRWVLVRLAPEEHWLLHMEHHVVHDGWSFNVFLGELAALYSAYSRGRPSPLPELPLQFADFAQWQRNWIKSEDAASQLAYWRRRLASLPAALALPYDHPRPAAQGFRGEQCRFVLPGVLADEVRELSRHHFATLFEVFLATFVALLYRYCGHQEDITIGCGVANRRWAATEGLIGMVLNTLLLRHDLQGKPLFSGLLERVRETARGAYANQDVPFEMLVEIARPERNPGRNPLFDVAFSFHDAPAASMELAGLELEVELGIANGSAKFDLNVISIVQPREVGGEGAAGPGAVEMIWEFDSGLFDRTTVLRMSSHFRCLLRGMLADVDCRLAELPLLAACERHQLTHEWGAARPGGREGSIHELFEAVAAAAPERLALSMGESRLSYAQLDARANRLARFLARLGVGAEAPVGICMERSLDLVVSALAILKAGGAYVPLEPAYPRERLALLIADSRVGWVLTHESLTDRLPAGARTVCIDRRAPEIAAEEAANPCGGAGPESLAYVAYTSGSTGSPKGVGVPHRGVVRLVCGADYADFGPGEVFLQLAPFSFDASTFEIWGPLLNGGRLVIAPPGPLALRDLGALVEQAAVTSLWLTAGLFHRMVDHELPSLRGVRQLLAGGDVLSPRHVREVLLRLPACRLVNGYGPTENTTFTTCFPVGGLGAGVAVSIGRPIPETEAYVVGAGGELAPPGCVGELWVGGRGLARGYLGNPGLTAERFVPHPFGGEGARLYRTGDRARWRLDGRLEFLGRLDRQVKVRGFRVELGEIEAALARHPAVRTVLVRDDGQGEDRRLLAYVVPGAGKAPSGEQLRAHLRRCLPDHMIPAFFVTLAELPLTANGKVDVRALPSAGGGRPDLEVTYAAPRDALEARIAAIWEELLDIAHVGVHDSFFDLGGNSFRMVEVHQRLQQELGRGVPILALFEHPDVHSLARHLAGEEAARRDPVPAGFAGGIAGGKDRLRRQLDRQRTAPAGGPRQGEVGQGGST